MLLIMLAIKPIKMLEPTLTYPAAGVMATRPTTAPIQAPKADGFLPLRASYEIQASIAAAEAVFVVIKADTARGDADRAEPALKPNQPNHNMPVPKITNGIFAGEFETEFKWVFLLPRYKAPARAAIPDDICT